MINILTLIDQTCGTCGDSVSSRLESISSQLSALTRVVLGLGDTEAGVLGDEDFTFLEKLFTCVSAFASVGFDLGVTARLDRWGQLVLLVGMFIGRLGILLLLSALFGRRPPSRVRYPQEELIL